MFIDVDDANYVSRFIWKAEFKLHYRDGSPPVANLIFETAQVAFYDAQGERVGHNYNTTIYAVDVQDILERVNRDYSFNAVAFPIVD